MPRNWIDRAIMLCMIAFVAWGIIGAPLVAPSLRAGNEPAKTAEKATDSARSQEPWLTKDAAGFFTFLLAVVGGFQVALFLWQLWLIRESLDDAKIAADAAKESADATREQAEISRAALRNAQEAAQVQLRAYLGHIGYKLHGNKEGDNLNAVGFQIVWRNQGQTPALSIVHVFAEDNDAIWFPGGEPDFQRSRAAGDFAAPMGKDGGFDTPLFYVSLQRIIESRENPIRIRSALLYDTVFHDIRDRISDITLSFQYIGLAEIDEIRQGNIGIGNFAVRPHGRHNKFT